jgi:hypothetical protein
MESIWGSMLADLGEPQAEARTTRSPIDRPEATKERFMAKVNDVGRGVWSVEK